MYMLKRRHKIKAKKRGYRIIKCMTLRIMERQQINIFKKFQYYNTRGLFLIMKEVKKPLAESIY
ncbi:hypothetical protein SBV1_gp43 [Sulfolobales Beppu virus 1]|nr:hypothetical protein SBV1_gp43 [Sulfolobales Beppu virus 1]